MHFPLLILSSAGFGVSFGMISKHTHSHYARYVSLTAQNLDTPNRNVSLFQQFMKRKDNTQVSVHVAVMSANSYKTYRYYNQKLESKRIKAITLGKV